MKKQIIKTIRCVALAFTLAGCLHTITPTAWKDLQRRVAISITHDGALLIAGEQCQPSQLASKLTELAAKCLTTVVVRADAGVPYRQVAAVMDACKTAGLQQVSLVATK